MSYSSSLASPASLAPVRGKLYSIPAANPFIETLARGILKESTRNNKNPLGEWLVFLPTRRACRELREALLRLSAPADLQEGEVAHAVLLPRLVALGDATFEQTERESVPALERRLLLAQLIEKWLDANESTTHAPSTPAAISLARALERLQQDFALEEANPRETLTVDMVPDNCAAHWHDALEFLRIVTDAWPQVLEERGLQDPSVERVRTLSQHAESIAEKTEKHTAPVVVAGSTGSVKATARLMRAVLSCPQGQVVLAGCPAPQDAFSPIFPISPRAISSSTLFDEGAESTHPLHPFRHLFCSWNMTQEEVASLLACYPAASAPSLPQRSRTALLAQAFSKLPAPLTLERPTGLTVLPCTEAQEEADLIALILREALEEKGQRAALITRDRTLARRVRSALRGRWNLAIEDTAQQPLAESHAAQLFLLTLKTLTPEDPAAAPDAMPLNIVALKALFARAGGVVALAWQNFEGSVLRKTERSDPTKTQRASASLHALRTLQKESQHAEQESTILLTQALATLAPLAEMLAGGGCSARADLLRCHRRCAENFASLCHTETDDDTSTSTSTFSLPPLYRFDGGQDLKRFCDTLENHWQENEQENKQEENIQENLQNYLPTLEALLAAETRRGLYATHPRLAILGALEARLLSFDLLVLGGMTEGSWPGEPDKSPFLPESLRAKVGLKSLEYNIGLSAQDFVNFASAPNRVVATYAARHNGQPRQPSRFVQRLQACHPCRDLAYEARLRAWLTHLQHGEGGIRATPSPTLAPTLAIPTFAVAAPAPKAPQASRPLRVSLTSLASLDEDPYSLYARQVLCLVPLETLRSKDEPSLYGSCLHACFEAFLQTFGRNKAQPTTERLKSIVAQQLARFAPSRFAQAFWSEPLLRSARQLLGRVKALQPRHLWCEVKGEHRITLEQGRSLTLSARADLVVEAEDGSWWLIDHKTGALPTRTSLGNLEQPQLVLGAWLLQQGAFRADGKKLEPTTLPQSCYWRFSGRRADNRVLVIDDKVWAKKDEQKSFETAQNFADACFARYEALLQRFDREETPYPARALSLPRANYDPYRHLARRQAWSFDAD